MLQAMLDRVKEKGDPFQVVLRLARYPNPMPPRSLFNHGDGWVALIVPDGADKETVQYFNEAHVVSAWVVWR
jgi:hypothetical protein